MRYNFDWIVLTWRFWNCLARLININELLSISHRYNWAAQYVLPIPNTEICVLNWISNTHTHKHTPVGILLHSSFNRCRRAHRKQAAKQKTIRHAPNWANKIKRHTHTHTIGIEKNASNASERAIVCAYRSKNNNKICALQRPWAWGAKCKRSKSILKFRCRFESFTRLN